MNWWNDNANLAWLGSTTTWWIVGPLIAVALCWMVLRISQRPRRHSEVGAES